MKATGIVRRIDDLGRVVIPKEIRRTSEATYRTVLIQEWDFCISMLELGQRLHISSGKKLKSE